MEILVFAATGAVVATTVGSMGLAIGGTAIAIHAPTIITTGVVLGIAAYGVKSAVFN